MGCSSSNAGEAAVKNKGSPAAQAAHQAKAAEAQRIKRLAEELEQQMQEEKEVSERLYAEKEGLRIKSNFMIEQKSSCDDLFELLEKKEIVDYRTASMGESHKSRKIARAKAESAHEKKEWIVRAICSSIHINIL